MKTKSPWIGHWWSYKKDNMIGVVKQDGKLKSMTAYYKDKAETTWIFLPANSEITFYRPGLGEAVASIPIEFIPLPPIEYLEEGTHEFELTENSYILYD